MLKVDAMDMTPAAVLRDLLRDDRSVVTRGCDERPLSALLAAALNENADLAHECLGLGGVQTFADGSNRQPDVMGYDSNRDVMALIEVKTGTALFNWSNADGRDQLTRYRESNPEVATQNRLLILPALRQSKTMATIATQGGSRNVPWEEIDQNWNMVTWEHIATWLADRIPQDRRVASVLRVIEQTLRVKN